MDRRLFLKASSLAMAGLGFAPRFLQAAAAQPAARGKVLVLVFQRGAADGLSMLPPLGDRRYAELRPTLALPAEGEGAALKLDGFFGLHPALGALLPFYERGRLAGIHGVGSPDLTRSHFDAQDFMESGTPGLKATEDGFLARALGAMPPAKAAPFRAVALQPNLPRSLAGDASALALASLDDFQIPNPSAGRGFEGMYGAALDEALRGAGREAAEALRALKAKDPRRWAPEAAYPASPLGRRMKEIAQLIKADLGLRVAVTDCGGWDTHVGQGAAKGQLAGRLQDFGDSLGAFLTDLGERMDDVLLVTLTEFGRTVRENGNRGTDHGHGSCLFVAGGAVRGRRVLARWRGLDPANLHEGRDLPVTVDYRDVMAELLAGHLGLKDQGRLFPGYALDPKNRLGILRA